MNEAGGCLVVGSLLVAQLKEGLSCGEGDRSEDG